MATQRYVAFLRGVMPTNAKMPALKRCFESAGFTDVRTVISSGNVVFTSQIKVVSEIERKAEAAMEKHLGRAFYAIVRAASALEKILRRDPYSRFELEEDPKRIVSFLRKPAKLATSLPIEVDGARILAMQGRDV